MFFVTFTMFFSGGMIPTYLVVRSLNMLNTRWAMWIPNAVAAWNLIITRTFFQTVIPDELHESARIDGAKNIRVLWSIVLPLSGPILAVISLFYAVGHWNTYFNALIYLQDKGLQPLQIVLRRILILNRVDLEASGLLDPEELTRLEFRAALMQYSLIVVALVPVMIIYPFVQRHFVRGILIGAIKG
jgi:putative aldouronate transport system permease protein